MQGELCWENNQPGNIFGVQHHLLGRLPEPLLLGEKHFTN
jgi:hypothetical protein